MHRALPQGHGDRRLHHVPVGECIQLLFTVFGLLVHVIIDDGGASSNKQCRSTTTSAILLVVLYVAQLVVVATALPFIIVLALISRR